MKPKTTLLILAEVKALGSFLSTTEKEAPERTKKNPGIPKLLQKLGSACEPFQLSGVKDRTCH